MNSGHWPLFFLHDVASQRPSPMCNEILWIGFLKGFYHNPSSSNCVEVWQIIPQVYFGNWLTTRISKKLIRYNDLHGISGWLITLLMSSLKGPSIILSSVVKEKVHIAMNLLRVNDFIDKRGYPSMFDGRSEYYEDETMRWASVWARFLPSNSEMMGKGKYISPGH